MSVQYFLTLILLTSLCTACPNEKNCAHCKYFQKASYCGKCYNSVYSRSNRGCDDSQVSVKNCVEYVEVGYPKCLRCRFGFGLDSQNQCQKCQVKDCAVCNGSPDKCSSCFGGKVGKGTCEFEIPELCKDMNCDVCDQSSDICQLCKPGFSMNNDLLCVEGMEGCQILADGKKNRCFLCNYSHYLNNSGVCVSNSEFDYPFYKSFYFWMFFLAIVLVTIGAQVYFNKYQERRLSGAFAFTGLTNLPQNEEQNSK